MRDAGFAPLLIAFFILGLGFALQQLVAQPLLLLLSSEKTGPYRLALAGGVNSLGTLTGPLFIGKIIYANELTSHLSIASLQVLYVVLTGIFILIMLALSTLRLPEFKSENKMLPHTPKVLTMLLALSCLAPFIFFAENVAVLLGIGKFMVLLSILFLIMGILLRGFWQGKKYPQLWGAWAYESVPLGMLAIFFYVGTEVSIVSNFNVVFGTDGIIQGRSADLICATALYWGGLMTGRWMASVDVWTQLSARWRPFLYYIAGTLAFMLIIWVHGLTGASQGISFAYLGVVAVFATLFAVAKRSPGLLLVLLSGAGIITLITGMLSEGILAAYAFMAGGLACSVIWPCVFYLALQRAGSYTVQASAFLVMMILGGALLPPLQGAITDMKELWGASLAVRLSYLVPVVGFAYLLFFALYMQRKGS